MCRGEEKDREEVAPLVERRIASVRQNCAQEVMEEYVRQADHTGDGSEVTAVDL